MIFLNLKMSKKIYSKKGFTLVETLVAISILLMAVVAPLTILAKNITAAFDAKNKVTALYLAEDAIDFVKYKIATNLNTPQFWLNGIPCLGGSACRVDSFDDDIVSCGGTCPALKFDSATGVYGYGAGSSSNFTRTISIAGVTNDPDPSRAPQEVIITATVLWQDHGVSKQITLTEHMLSWR